MSRIAEKFRRIQERGAKAFIAYIMAGDPSLQRTAELVDLLVECGADIIELGVPFSDPLADGPTIQRAAKTALANGVTLRSVIALVGELRRRTQVPIVLMTYYNLIMKYGEERFVRDASEAGIDGLIAPDLPPDEAGELLRYSRKRGFDLIFLLAPTSTPERIERVSSASAGFIYYVSMTGVTGGRLSLEHSIGEHIASIAKKSGKPIAIGFGISSPSEASSVAALADGVIVGSAIVKHAAEPDGVLREYLSSLRRAIG